MPICHVADSTCQLSLGAVSSMPNGSLRYSQRRRVGDKSPSGERPGAVSWAQKPVETSVPRATAITAARIMNKVVMGLIWLLG